MESSNQQSKTIAKKIRTNNNSKKIRSKSTSKKWKSKTIAKKIRTNNTSQKRKLDEDNINTKNQPFTKKRKLNVNNSYDEPNALIDKLTKERNHYKEGCIIYKNEADKWKSKYIKLCSQTNTLIVEMNKKVTRNKTKHLYSDNKNNNDNQTTVVNNKNNNNDNNFHTIQNNINGRRKKSIYRLKSKIHNGTSQADNIDVDENVLETNINTTYEIRPISFSKGRKKTSVDRLNYDDDMYNIGRREVEMDINKNTKGDMLSDITKISNCNEENNVIIMLKGMKYPKLQLSKCVNDFDEYMMNIISNDCNINHKLNKRKRKRKKEENNCCRTGLLLPFSISRCIGGCKRKVIDNEYVQCSKCKQIYA